MNIDRIEEVFQHLLELSSFFLSKMPLAILDCFVPAIGSCGKGIFIILTVILIFLSIGGSCLMPGLGHLLEDRLFSGDYDTTIDAMETMSEFRKFQGHHILLVPLVQVPPILFVQRDQIFDV